MSVFRLRRERRDEAANFSGSGFLFARRWRLEGPTAIAAHQHEWHELVWNRDPAGPGRRHGLVVDGARVEYGDGDLLYLPPFSDHSFDCLPGLGIVVIGVDQALLAHAALHSLLAAPLGDLCDSWKRLPSLLRPPGPEMDALCGWACSSELGLLDSLRLVLDLDALLKGAAAEGPRPEAEGYRPGTAGDSDRSSALRLAIAYLEERYRADCGLDDCAREAGISPASLSRIFKRGTGMSLPRYLQTIRVRHAKTLLEGSALPVVDVALECGFGDPSRFSRVFAAHEGCSPARWRAARGGPGPHESARAEARKDRTGD